MVNANQNIKSPNVAGQFYPADPKELSAEIDGYLKQAQVAPDPQPVRMLIAPHAGYMYSAPVAAYSFKSASLGKYKTVIVIGPSHYLGFDGISIGLFDGYQTPLGTIPVDLELAKNLIDEKNGSSFVPEAFNREHSVEVELPFIQKIFPDAKIIPILVGQPDLSVLDKFAHLLSDKLKTRTDILLVLSTDMSHYHPAAEANAMDHATIETVKKFDVKNLWTGCVTRKLELCGFMPVTIGLLYAQYQGIHKIDFLKYADSGDATGDKTKVVGYMAAVFK
ncbi:MAG: AmmeMemoRadiSam system protein B [Candidatus Omnitrophica bacterium]|nr:AmmeMemoRadiSam system protein B [Candidatus Omnitrophota bacterium]